MCCSSISSSVEGIWGQRCCARRQRRARLSLPRVVVCTGLSRNRVASYAPEIAASNACVVLKPFDIDELTIALRVAALGAPELVDG